MNFDGCDPGANPWVEKYFRDCVMDVRDYIGFTLGLFSIFVWLTAQLPQFISNMKNQSSEALSIWFLVEWFAGDTLNLLGCLIQGQQLPTTTILAAYFVLMDVIMLLQFIYYGALQARRKRLRLKSSRRRHSHRHASTPQLRNRDEQHQQTILLLQDGEAHAECNELSSAGPDSSAAPTSAGDASQRPAEPGRPPGADQGRSKSNLRTLAAAATAGVSVVCVAALTLHPSGSPSAGRHLLALQEQPHHPAALLGGGDAGFGPGDISSPGGSASSSLGLAAAGAALSVVGRSLAVVLHPAAALFGSGGGGGDSGSGDGDGGSSERCSFLNCDMAMVAGTAMGYLSTCFYLASRVSQIRKNLARKSTEGLSPTMFLLTMSANLCTGISIVLRLRSGEQAREQLPWMCGTFGTIALDMSLFYQTMTLGQGGHDSHDPHHHHHHHHHHHAGQGQGHATSQLANGQHAHGLNGCASSWGEAAEGLAGGKVTDLEAPLLRPIPDADADGDVPGGAACQD